MKRKSYILSPRSQKYDSPYRYWMPDIHTKNPGFGIKGGVTGALQQPAEYIGRYAWRHYGGTEKTRALAWKAQREIPLWLKKQIIHRYYWDKYYAKTLQKKTHVKTNGKTKKSTRFQSKYHRGKQKRFHFNDSNSSRWCKSPGFRGSCRKSRIPL